MSEKMTEQEKEKRIQEHIQIAGIPEDVARFMVAMESGEIDGDVIAIDDDEDPPQ